MKLPFLALLLFPLMLSSCDGEKPAAPRPSVPASSSPKEAAVNDLAPLEEAVRDHPRDPAAKIRLARALHRRERLQEAAGQYRAALDNDSGCTDALLGLCRITMQIGDLEGALRFADRAILNDPGSVTALDLRGTLLVRLGRHREALAVFRETLRLHPDDGVAHLNASQCAEQLGEKEEALRHAITAAEKMPKDPIPLMRQARIHAREKEYDKALSLLDRAAQLAPRDGTVLFHRGMTLRALDRLPEARRSFQKALGIDLPPPMRRQAEALLKEE